MPFNLSSGLSEMGKTVANTAGDMMLNQQRADLERQRLELAETLAEGRETRGRVQAADIADKASTKEQNFRAGESVLNRSHEDANLATREEGENTRAKLSADTEIKARNLSEGAANSRFTKEMDFKVQQAKDAATSENQKRTLDAIIKTNTKTIDVPFPTEGNPNATRPAHVPDPDMIAKSLRNAKDPDLVAMADIFAPKPENKVPPTPKSITGKVGLQWNAQKQRFRDAAGVMYDKDGRRVE